jgi:hypothetical protein
MRNKIQASGIVNLKIIDSSTHKIYNGSYQYAK